MSELTGVRWTRFGKDRLYVKDGAGADVGWVDLVSGVMTLQRPELANEVAGLAALCRAGLAPEPAAEGVIEPGLPAQEPPPEPAQQLAPEWVDLAGNRPGQAARAKANEELAAMRERTRVGTWLARALDVKTDERAWRVGAEGEETVGAKLEKLTKDGWHVLHSVPVGKRDSDIDHVLIGPGGVFTINTKKHPGKKVWVSKTSVLVNGHRTDYLRNSRHEGERASRLLSEQVGFPVFVKPVLIFTTDTLIPDVTIKSQPDDVAILDRMAVPGAFKRSPNRLAVDEIDAVYGAARRSTTWDV